jgi:hypothetical protein
VTESATCSTATRGDKIICCRIGFESVSLITLKARFKQRVRVKCAKLLAGRRTEATPPTARNAGDSAGTPVCQAFNGRMRDGAGMAERMPGSFDVRELSAKMAFSIGCLGR